MSALAASVGVLEPVGEVLLRANGYSLATALGASVADDRRQRARAPSAARSAAPARRSALLVASVAAFAGLAALLLRRRDVV